MKHKKLNNSINSRIQQDINTAYTLILACVTIIEAGTNSKKMDLQVWKLLQLALQKLDKASDRAGKY